MIKRNSRNIGKIVTIAGHKDFNDRLGKVTGYRGDFAKGDPVVNVYVYSLGSIWPFPGSHLHTVKKERK